MRLYVSEFVSGGAWAGELPYDSLLPEGESMLRAVADDFACIQDCDVVTTRDSRLRPFRSETVDVIVVSGPDQERRLFERLAAECDATFVIAPETNRTLAARRELVDAVVGRFLGPSPEAIELCTDKLQLAEHLLQNEVPTIETHLVAPDLMDRDLPFPIVVKPRDGAGSENTWLVSDRKQLEMLFREWSDSPESRPDIWQPYVPGTAASVAAVIQTQIPGISEIPGISRIDVFPPAEQRLSSDGRFRYLGGRVPAAGFDREMVERLVRRACDSVGGLSGYVGFDVILPAGASDEPVIVEINPRLTTSYLGYRAITANNLAARILFPDRCPPEISWMTGPVTFLPDGTVTM